VIQGLRLLPFTADKPYWNCSTCMNGDKKMDLAPNTDTARRIQGCGWLPRAPRVERTLVKGLDFIPGEGEQGKPGFEPVCPGYYTALPEVQETVRIRPQWLKGNFAQYVAGPGVVEDLSPALNAQAVLERAIVEKQNHDTEERAREAEEKRRNGY